MKWLSVRMAAGVLGVTEGALRRRLERNARAAEGGATTAKVDGLEARKWGSHWRVLLGNWDPNAKQLP